jgi:hypothetical protein
MPLTVEVSVKELVEVETVSVCDVEDAMRLVRSVEVATPLIVVVRIVPDVERAFDDMTEDVAVTPLIVVVKVLPESDWVKELMRVTREEEIPFTIVWRKLGDEEAILDVMIDVVPTEPPMVDVKTLLDEESVLEVFKVVMVAEETVRSVIVVVARDTVPVAVREPTVRALNDGDDATDRTLPAQRRLDPAVIRVDGVV